MFESLPIPAVDRFAVVDGIGSDSPLSESPACGPDLKSRVLSAKYAPPVNERQHFTVFPSAIHPVMDYRVRDFTALATAISPAGDHKHGII